MIYIKAKRRIIYALCVTAVLLIGVFTGIYLWQGNNTIDVTEYVFCSDQVTEGMDQSKVVLISDLHNKRFGKDNAKLFGVIKEQKPDVIFITGDIIDGRRKGFKKTEEFVKGVIEIAPVYYVTGNHEFYLDDDERQRLFCMLEQNGIIVLRDQSLEITLGTQSINLIGVDDPNEFYQRERETVEKLAGDDATVLLSKYIVPKILRLKKYNSFNLLLSHRPDFFDDYSQTGVDLVLSGHTHGGQIRARLVDMIWEAFSNKISRYVGGVWSRNTTQMIVSRGIGNSLFPFRINNNPEVVTVTFKAAK